MLVHDGHFLCQFKEIFIIPPNRPDFFFLNLTSTSSWISDHNLRTTTLLTVCLWVYFELWTRLLLLSFFINYLFVFDSGMSGMVDLMIVSSYYLWADSPLLHCVLVYVPVWLCALSCMFVSCVCVWGGGEWGETMLYIHIKYIFVFVLFFSLEN